MRASSQVDRRVHLLRLPLPWRKDELVTMCGRKVNERCRVVELEEFNTRPCQYDQRAENPQCAACENYSQAEHHWADPIQNELLQPSSEPKRIHSELEAIKELIERHRAEFESLLAATTAEASLQAPTKPVNLTGNWDFGLGDGR